MICCECGLPLPESWAALSPVPASLCLHHSSGLRPDWAQGNRLMCDFFHRGQVPQVMDPHDPEWWEGSLHGEEWDATCVPR